jgi:hypothetical protein
MSVGGSFIDGESHILLDENSISSAVENFASGTQESSSTNFTSSGTVCYQGRITRIIDASRSLVELDSGKVCCYLLHQPICVWRHLLSLTGSDDCNGSWLVRLMNIHWILNGGNSNSNNNGGTAVEFVCCFNSSVEFVSFHLHRPGNNYRPVSINNLNSIPSREEQTLSAKDSILTGRAVGLLGRLLKAKPQSMDLFKDAKRRLIDTLFRLVPPQPVDIYGEFFDHENQCHINSMPVPLSAGPCLISVDDLLDLISAYKFHAHSAVTQAACFNQQHPQQRFGIANNRRLNFLIDSVPVGALFPNTASVWLLARLVATPATTLALMSESGKQALAVCNWPLVSSSSLADPGGVYLIRLCASNSSLATVVCEKLPGNIGGDGYSKQSVTLRFDDATSAISSTDDESDTSIHLLCPVRSNNSVFPALAAVSPTKILVFIESADPPSFIRSGFSDCGKCV